MHVGVMFANGSRSAEPPHAAALAQAAEALGFESLWAVQHVAMPVEQVSRYPYSERGTIPGGSAIAIPDPLVWLAWVGALTSRIRLATGVFVLPQQHPLVVAKQVATLDRLVGGRVILGVGAGWLREEYDAVGAEFEHRGARLDEQIDALRAAWAPGPSGFEGEHVRYHAMHSEPKPVSPVPIVIGGHTPAAARRAGRLADGFFPLGVQGERLRRLVAIVRDPAEETGRDAAAIEITAEAARDPSDRDIQRDLGVARVVVNAPDVDTPGLFDALGAALDRAR